jgi:hypothetical protein
MVMVNYYGGHVVDELNESCTHAFATDYESVFEKFEQANKTLKVVTPDWILDCIEKNCIVDEIEYHPKYLITNSQNKQILDKLEEEKQAQNNKEIAEDTTKKEILDDQVNQTVTSELIKNDTDSIESNKVSQAALTSVPKLDDSNELTNKTQDKSIDSQRTLETHEVKQVNVIKLNNFEKSSNTLLLALNLKNLDENKKKLNWDNSENELKNLSASSIQSQLENTIKFNQINDLGCNQSSVDIQSPIAQYSTQNKSKILIEKTIKIY